MAAAFGDVGFSG